MNLDLQSILDRDPISEVENMMGRRWNEIPPGSVGAGMMLAQAFAVNQQKRSALSLFGDSHFGTTLAEYEAIIADIGFRQVLAIPFQKPKYEHADTFFVYWHDSKGILLVFDTYGGKSVNGGNFYYNWKATTDNRDRITSSGGWRTPKGFRERPRYETWELARQGDRDAIAETESYNAEFRKVAVWIGSHDCREAIRHNIDKLEANGEFVVPWLEPGYVWLCHYGDTKEGYGHETRKHYDRVKKERAAMLPQNVREKTGLGSDS